MDSEEIKTTSGRMVEVLSDGRTVWVNANDGSSIGRFGFGGIDIHKEVSAQKDGTQCLDCTHKTPDLNDWRRFVDGMLTHHGVHVSEKHRPTWLSLGHRKDGPAVV